MDDPEPSVLKELLRNGETIRTMLQRQPSTLEQFVFHVGTPIIVEAKRIEDKVKQFCSVAKFTADHELTAIVALFHGKYMRLRKSIAGIQKPGQSSL